MVLVVSSRSLKMLLQKLSRIRLSVRLQGLRGAVEIRMLGYIK